eukprot:1163157-Prymnesium_polylepis.1
MRRNSVQWGPGTPILRSVRLRKRMGGTGAQADVGLRRRTVSPARGPTRLRAAGARRLADNADMSVVAVLRARYRCFADVGQP